MIAGTAVYANSLRGPFLLDDRRAIVDNTTIRRLSPISTPLHPPRQSPVTGRPLVNLSFAVNHAIGGLAVEGFHAGNIAVHVLAALALFGVLHRTFARTSIAGIQSAARLLALICALVWVVHPLNSEAVNYATQRTELMMGLFSLVTLYAAIRALGKGARRWEWIAAAAAFCAVASKETALTLPLIVALWDRAFHFGGVREAWASRRRLYGLLAASWLLFGYFSPELPFFREGGFELHVSRGTYLLHQASMVVQYLTLSVWPRALVFDYGAVPPTTLGAVWPALSVVVVLLIASVVAFLRVPAVGFWAAWFWITLAPASSFIPIPTEVGAERRMYLPLIGVVVVIAVGITVLLRKLPSTDARVRIGVAAAAVVAIGLGGFTVRRNVDYQSGLRIWQDVLNRRPHFRAHEHVSMYLRDAGRIDESIVHLRTAAPESPKARHALASALLERGDVAESVGQFREFVTQNPNSSEIVRAREEFAVALARAGDREGALEQYRIITSLAPDYARGHLGLADAFFRRNDWDGAMREYREALRLQPDNVGALASLGALLASRGERAEALTVLRRAVTLEPRALPPRRDIVQLLLEANDFVEMEKEARAWASFAPRDPEVHNLLGVALASQQQFGPAGERFEEALRLDPSHQEARANLLRIQGLTLSRRR